MGIWFFKLARFIMLPGKLKRTKVFISCSRKDADWLEEIHTHLKPLERNHKIDIWDRTKIKPGSNRKEQIKAAIDTAKVAVLLISPDFIADPVTEEELPLLLSAAEKEGMVILPLIISNTSFLNEQLADLQPVNDDSKPLAKLSRNERAEILVRLAREIQDMFSGTSVPETIEKGKTAPPNNPPSFSGASLFSRVPPAGKARKFVYSTVALLILAGAVWFIVNYITSDKPPASGDGARLKIKVGESGYDYGSQVGIKVDGIQLDAGSSKHKVSATVTFPDNERVGINNAEANYKLSYPREAAFEFEIEVLDIQESWAMFSVRKVTKADGQT